MKDTIRDEPIPAFPKIVIGSPCAKCIIMSYRHTYIIKIFFSLNSSMWDSLRSPNNKLLQCNNDVILTTDTYYFRTRTGLFLIGYISAM